MLLKYNNWLAFLGSVLVYFFLHEGLHFSISLCYDEFHKLIFHLYGPEIVYITIVENRKGFQWFLISGMSNMFTIALGYALYLIKRRILEINIVYLKSFLYYLTIIMLLVDPLNLSIGPFIYGGDAKGIATGLGINIYYIQLVSMVVFLINRELAAQFILQSGVQVKSCILKPINKNKFIEAVNRLLLKRSDKSPRIHKISGS